MTIALARPDPVLVLSPIEELAPEFFRLGCCGADIVDITLGHGIGICRRISSRLSFYAYRNDIRGQASDPHFAAKLIDRHAGLT